MIVSRAVDRGVFDTIADQLRLEDHAGRTLARGLRWVAARLLALAATWHNGHIGSPSQAPLITYGR
jgi:hypothetical protein